jgi:hypothetical protein
MARQYPHSIRHRRAFEAWYQAGRKITDAVHRAAGRSARETLYTWRDAEDWDAFADTIDAAAAASIVVTHEQYEADAHSKAYRLVSDMLAAARYAVAKVAQGMVNGQADALDIGAAARLSTAAVSAADTLYGWSKLRVEHSGTVEHVDTDALRARLIARITQGKDARA